MDYKKLLKYAKEVSKKAYAKYSDFSVGASVLTSSGKIYSGCNVENASYGLSICAERNAITSAVTDGETDFEAIAIYSPKMQKCWPCGACRQFIFEFQKDKEIFIITEENGECCVKSINELFPEGFKL